MSDTKAAGRAAAHAPLRIVVCADDYGFTPGVSRGIRELIAARRISATSVMTVSEYWPGEASALAAVAGDADIGLHLTLTDQRPLGPMPELAPGGQLPPIARLMSAGFLRRLPLAEIEAEIERQLAAFIAHYGRPPDHIDGHHHMHQLPGVRRIVLRVAARVGAGRIWVRSCADDPRRIARRGIAVAKALVISGLGAGLAAEAALAGVTVNRGFSGVYDFAGERRPLPYLFGRFLSELGSGGVVMCHPGYSDTVLAARDVMTVAREAEQSFLMSEAWTALLAGRGMTVGPLRGPDPG